MPLRQRRTRIILAPYPLLALVFGLGYILASPQRLASPSLAFAKTLAPMWAWGVLFLVGAAALTGAAIANSPRIFARALQIGGGIYTWWAACLLIAAFTQSGASLNAWAAYAFIAGSHFTLAWLLSTRTIT